MTEVLAVAEPKPVAPKRVTFSMKFGRIVHQLHKIRIHAAQSQVDKAQITQSQVIQPSTANPTAVEKPKSATQARKAAKAAKLKERRAR